MRQWLQETHGPKTELFRHFLLRFLDSDLITAPEHTSTMIVGGISVLLPWFPLFAQPLLYKYAHFSAMPVPGPYRQAVLADELWLITLMMSGVGLLTAVKWQSLFPSWRDYQALGSLPLRPRQIFAAKLLALLAVVTGSIIAMNSLPGLTFPLVCISRWQINPSLGAHLRVHAIAFAAGCYFFFFALLALQGVLLNLLPPRPFGRVTGTVQGFLVAIMLVLIVLSFSIDSPTAAWLARPELARWLPPVWFVGLYQTMLGDPDPAMHTLSQRAVLGLLISAALASLCYLVSYQRHRELLVEGAARASKDRKWAGAVLDWVIPNPRQQAVIVFMAKTLLRSSQHRMILMGYGGFGTAILLTGVIGMREAVSPARTAAACFVYAHVILLAFVLIGLRHLFSLPAELRANWTFQMTEGEGRRDWLRAMDRFVLCCGAVTMLAIPFPLEVRLLGWRAVAESLLFIALALLCYEWSFSEWEKLPFTCSYLPGKTPMWIMSLELLGLLGLFPIVNGLLLVSLFNRIAYVVVLALLLGPWIAIHIARRQGRGERRLKYEEAPDPAVHGLNLLAQ
jgi:hypothetical protein